MTEATQILLITVITVLTIILTVIGIQIIYILREFRRTVEKINKILDEGGVMAKNMGQTMEGFGGLLTGVKTAFSVFNFFKKGKE